jgi:alkanesulfonate monooxygenase SsuD/methylene tetrahydromethanopterin reductase-like flavin-dependent oxidoreductase (luciferase family)
MEKPVTWSGSVRASLSNQEVYPKTELGHIPVSIAVGSKPDSLVRTAQHGLPVVLAIVGNGTLEHFASYAELYRRALAQAGAPDLPVAAQSNGFVADTDEEAIETMWPHLRPFMSRIARERGFAPPTRERFEEDVRSGTYQAGSPETVAQKIAATITAVGLERFDLRVSAGTLPHEKIMRSIELYATRVVPRVRELLA